MPVARSNPRRTLLVAAAAVVFAVGIVALALVANSIRGGGGGEQFDTLEIETLLSLQSETPVPACVPDPVNGNRPICVFHLDGPDDEGWVAYDFQVDGCEFEPLTPESTELVDSCTGDTYPFDGTGLPQYPTEVVDGRLVIDLLGTGDTSTTTAPTTGGD